MRYVYAFGASAAVLCSSSVAPAQTAFVEGHVFNKRTGVPISGTVVRVIDTSSRGGPGAEPLAVGLTDANGFYQFEIDRFFGRRGVVDVICSTDQRDIRGRSNLRIRDGLIRRDIYLTGPWRLSRCQPPELE